MRSYPKCSKNILFQEYPLPIFFYNKFSEIQKESNFDIISIQSILFWTQKSLPPSLRFGAPLAPQRAALGRQPTAAAGHQSRRGAKELLATGGLCLGDVLGNDTPKKTIQKRKWFLFVLFKAKKSLLEVKMVLCQRSTFLSDGRFGPKGLRPTGDHQLRQPQGHPGVALAKWVNK